MHVEPRILLPVKRVLEPVRRFLAASLSTSSETTSAQTDKPLFSLAFVDYARGNGRAIGPQQAIGWSPELLSDDLLWVSSYHGLWGLDTRDPFGGERAPAGPKFDRDGSVRRAWHDPLGWSGLDKVPAPANLISETEAAITALGHEAEQTRAEIADKRAALRAQGITLQALLSTSNLEKQLELNTGKLAMDEAELRTLTDRYAELQEKERLLRDYLIRIRAGDRGDPGAHLRNRAVPETTPPKLARALDIWAAASGALLVTTIVLLAFAQPAHWPLWIALALLLFGLIEARLRNKAADYLLTTTIILAVIGAVTLAIEYWSWVIPAVLIGIFVLSLLNNLRELRARRTQGTHDG
jgi:hypothetical protein